MCAIYRDQDQFIDLIIDEAVFVVVVVLLQAFAYTLELYVNKEQRYTYSDCHERVHVEVLSVLFKFLCISYVCRLISRKICILNKLVCFW